MVFLGAMFEPVLFLNSMCAWSMEVGKTVDQSFGASFNKPVFLQKFAENDYFDQRLEWAAPKRWSKYTTSML